MLMRGPVLRGAPDDTLESTRLLQQLLSSLWIYFLARLRIHLIEERIQAGATATRVAGKEQHQRLLNFANEAVAGADTRDRAQQCLEKVNSGQRRQAR